MIPGISLVTSDKTTSYLNCLLKCNKYLCVYQNVTQIIAKSVRIKWKMFLPSLPPFFSLFALLSFLLWVLSSKTWLETQQIQHSLPFCPKDKYTNTTHFKHLIVNVYEKQTEVTNWKVLVLFALFYGTIFTPLSLFPASPNFPTASA